SGGGLLRHPRPPGHPGGALALCRGPRAGGGPRARPLLHKGLRRPSPPAAGTGSGGGLKALQILRPVHSKAVSPTRKRLRHRELTQLSPGLHTVSAENSRSRPRSRLVPEGKTKAKVLCLPSLTAECTPHWSKRGKARKIGLPGRFPGLFPQVFPHSLWKTPW